MVSKPKTILSSESIYFSESSTWIARLESVLSDRGNTTSDAWVSCIWCEHLKDDTYKEEPRSPAYFTVARKGTLVRIAESRKKSTFHLPRAHIDRLYVDTSAITSVIYVRRRGYSTSTNAQKQMFFTRAYSGELWLPISECRVSLIKCRSNSEDRH